MKFSDGEKKKESTMELSAFLGEIYFPVIMDRSFF